MNAVRDFLRHALSLPLEEQREALWPGYKLTYDAYGRDWELNTATIADDYELIMAGSRRIPDWGEVRGRADYVREHQAMLEYLNVERVVLDDVRPLGEGRVLALIRLVIRAGGGTIEQQAADLHEFRDGELVRQTIWFDREEGLRELGL